MPPQTFANTTLHQRFGGEQRKNNLAGTIPNNSEALIMLILDLNLGSVCVVVVGNRKGLSRKYQNPASA